MKRIAFLLIIIIGSGFISGTKKEVPFTKKEFQNLAINFESKQDLLDFFEFQKGDVAAHVMASNANYVGALSLLTNDITFYVEALDPKNVNQKKIDKTKKHYSKLKGAPITNQINFRIGTEKQTNLREVVLDKIILSSTFHELKYQDDLIEDMKNNLKPNGKIFILETECEKKGHYNFTCEEVTEIMQKHGFRPIKKVNHTVRETWAVAFERS